jgi:signal peptidase
MHQCLRHLRRGAAGAGNLLLVAVTLVGAAYVVLSLLGFERYVITGGSMSGSIEKYSVVVERRVPVEDLRVGDVITYLPPPDSGVTNLVTHRIHTVRHDRAGRAVLRTKGDANARPDPWRFSLTSEDQPVVVASVPEVGRAFLALADRETRMLVVGAPAAAIALLSVVQLLRALGDRRAPVPPARPAGGAT